MLEADSWPEFLVGLSIVFLFGSFSIFLLFENKIKKIPSIKRLAAFTERYRLEFWYSFNLLGLIAMAVAAIFSTPENAIMNGIRIFALIFCPVVIILLIIMLVKLKKDPSRFYGSRKPHE
jgi:predicted lysophospholipase L1 biosynthesis ABC-type transport system permease subunit